MFIVAVGVTLPRAGSTLDESTGVEVSSTTEVLIMNPAVTVVVGSAVFVEVPPVLPGLDVEVLIDTTGLGVSVVVFVMVRVVVTVGVSVMVKVVVMLGV